MAFVMLAVFYAIAAAAVILMISALVYVAMVVR